MFQTTNRITGLFVIITVTILSLLLGACESSTTDSCFLSSNNELPSPSGSFIALQEDNVLLEDGKYYRVHILTQDRQKDYTTEILFRYRDSNFIIWAEDEDILWAYSGDLGLFCWIWEDNDWTMYSSLAISEATQWSVVIEEDTGEFSSIALTTLAKKTLVTPRLLVTKRPKIGKRVTFYGLPANYFSLVTESSLLPE